MNAPIAAAQVELTRPAGAVSVTVVPLTADVLVRWAEVGDRVHVAWVGLEAVAGPQVRLEVARPEGTVGGSTVVAARGFPSSTGTEITASAFVWREPSGPAVVAAPSLPGPVPYDGFAPLALEAAFADHPLGDVNADGVLDARDALRWLDGVRYGNWTDFRRYHADLDADDIADEDDLALLLDKIVDPTLPARLHVRPGALSFVQLDPLQGDDALVLVANQGSQPLSNLTWDLPSGLAATTVGGIAGHSAAFDLTVEDRREGLAGFARLRQGADDEAAVRVGHLVVLIAGQSNASGRGLPLSGWPDVATNSVRTLANDYRWKPATEPLDVATAQVDAVSVDDAAAYSFGTRLGHRLWGSTGFETYLIPSALGGSRVGGTQDVSWLPSTDRLDRTWLFGSANFRAHVSAGRVANPVADQPFPHEAGPVNVIVWYQGESDATSSTRRGAFVGGTDAVMDAFVDELAATVIFVQLASHRDAKLNEQQLAIAELQRRMETGSGRAEARANFHMVVAVDLPRSDQIHPSAYGQRVLAERIELAVREHVLGEAVDGTGPRLVAIQASGLQVDVATTHVLDAAALDPGLFRVYDGAPDPANVDDFVNYGQNAIPITSVALHPTDPRTVRITLQFAPTNTPHVRYWARPTIDPEPESTWSQLLSGVVRAADGGLPLPGFGPIAAP